MLFRSSVEQQAVSIWAGTTGRMDSIPVADVRRFEAELLEFITRNHKSILDVIAETRDLSDDTVSAMSSAVEEFKKQFKVTA